MLLCSSIPIPPRQVAPRQRIGCLVIVLLYALVCESCYVAVLGIDAHYDFYLLAAVAGQLPDNATLVARSNS